MVSTHKTNGGRGAYIAAGAMTIAASESMARERRSRPDRTAEIDAFLAQIKDHDENVRYKAWSKADELGSIVMQPLAKLLVSDRPGVAKAAEEALNRIVHSVGKSTEDRNRRQVTRELMSMLFLKPNKIREYAFRALSLIADADSVLDIAQWAVQEDLREEVVYCLQRIPGEEASDALISLLKKAPDEFKPRILAALGQRRCEKALPALEEAMQSPDKTVAMAAMKAIAYIGIKTETSPPEFDELTPRQKAAYVNNMMRYCDGLIERGNVEDAKGIIKFLLTTDVDLSEHYICAAIVCAAKTDDADLKNLVASKREHKSYIVRDTAEKALKKMGG